MAGGGWLSASDDWKLTDSEILKAIAGVHPKYYLGTRAGKASKYAVLDIDAGSRYHSKDGISKITALLEKAGISEYNLYRSSYSGGWHLYIFFDAPVSSRDLYKQFLQLFRLHDFEVAKGTLEIFPNPGDKSLGQGLRLPLQPGFAWLNVDNLVVRDDRDEMSPSEALFQFVRDMECANPYHQFHRLKAYVEQVASTRETIVARAANSTRLAEVIPIRPSQPPEGSEDAIAAVKAVFRKLPPGIKAETWLKGREYYYHGLTGPSQRADAVFALSHYLFYGDPERLIAAMGYGYENERKWLIDEVLKTKHHGQSKDIAAGRTDAIQQIERAANWLPPHRRGQTAQKYEPVVPISWVRNNENRASQARRKIIAAVEDFREAQMPFSSRDLSLKCGVSSRTLSKYPELWKPAMEELRSGRLETALHEYNAVEGATSQESQPPTPIHPKIMPPGRLAARRIVHELKMRSVREEQQKQLAAVRSEKGAGERWRYRVDSLIEKDLPGGSNADLRIRINLLARELLLAPTEEDWIWLSGYISTLKDKVLADGLPVQVGLGLSAPAS